MMKTTLALFAVAGLVSATFAGDNLFPCEKMDQASKTGKPTGWWGSANTKIDQENRPEEGYNSLYVTGNKMVESNIKIQGGNTYQVSYMVKTKDFVKNQTHISFQIIWSAKGKYLMTDYKGQQVWHMKIEDTTTALDWTPVSWTCTAPAAADHAYIRILQKGKIEKSSFWIAKWRMEDITPAPAAPAAEPEKK